MEKSCLFCGKSFKAKTKRRVYCSKKCAGSIRVNCSNCNKEVIRQKTPNKEEPRFCSQRCSNEFRGRVLTVECDFCGHKYERQRSVFRRNKRNFCSEDCQHNYLKDNILCKCVTCGKEFFTIKSYEHIRKYCSHECRRCVLPEDELRRLYLDKKLSIYDISKIFGVSESAVSTNMKDYKIKARPNVYPNQDILICIDGTKVKSRYEKEFYERLYKLGIEFEYEPRLPCDKRFASDFLVKDVYIEIWGIEKNKSYDERRVRKTKLYRKHGLKLLEVYPKDFKDINGKIQELKRLIS